MKKRIYFYKIKSLLIIILTILITTVSIAPKRVYAVGAVENYINSSTVEQISNEALKDLFAQTGYRVGSQAEIDAIRQKAIKEVPQLVKKSPVFFGSPISAPTGEEIDKIMESDFKQFGIGYSSSHELQIAITADLRKWVNDTIDSLSVVSDAPNINSSIKTDGNFFSVSGTVTGTATDWTGTRNFKLTPSGWSYVDTYTLKTISPGGGGMLHMVEAGLVFFDSNYNSLGSTSLASCGKWNADPDTLPSVTISSGVSPVRFTNNKTNYLPYPTTQSEVGTQKVPVEIAIPTTVGTDGLVSPQITPSQFPTVKVPTPTTDSYIAVGSSTISYTDPTIDPTTGQIIDPTVPPVTDPTIPPVTDPTVPENDVPQLDFTPLQVATRKFPFCIPWDLWDTYKIFESNSQPFKYDFKQVDVNFGYMGAGSITVLPNFSLNFADYPQIDVAVKVLKFIELMLFIVFLILKTRNLIRG